MVFHKYQQEKADVWTLLGYIWALVLLKMPKPGMSLGGEGNDTVYNVRCVSVQAVLGQVSPLVCSDGCFAGGCRNPRSEQCQTFSNEESGAVPVLQVTLEGGRCTHRSGLQSLLKPMFSEFQALSTLHFLAIKWTESDIPPAKAKQIKSPSPPFSSEKPPLLAKRQAPNFSPCQERGQAGVTESPLAASPVFFWGVGGGVGAWSHWAPKPQLPKLCGLSGLGSSPAWCFSSICQEQVGWYTLSACPLGRLLPNPC